VAFVAAVALPRAGTTFLLEGRPPGVRYALRRRFSLSRGKSDIAFL
jgi:hypothetical protein